MSIYYILVNKDKKEWIDSGDIGLGLSEWHYETCVTPLLGYLMLDEFNFNRDEQYNPAKHYPTMKIHNDDDVNDGFSFQGHWRGDTHIQLVSEHTVEYDICHGMEDQYKYNAYQGSKESWENELKQWVNISIPLAQEWNHQLRYWYGNSPDMKDWMKQHLFEL